MKNLVLMLILSFALFGCNKEGIDHPCYDELLVHENACLNDCPGFKGCDGETYCNECEAARLGIGPK